MAFENLFITNKSKIGGISIDGSIREVTTRTMRISSNPIEDGSNIADHVIREPIRVVIEGVITDTPMGLAAFTDGSASTIGGVVDSISGIFGKSTSSGDTRSRQAYKELVSLLEKKELLEIVTKLETYDNLIFESITVNQDKTTAKSVFFLAYFSEALVVISSSSYLDAENITLGKDSAGYGELKNGGAMPTTIASDSSEKSAADSIGSI